MAKIIKYESSNFQWIKLFLNWFMIFAMIGLNLLRTNPAQPTKGNINHNNKDWVLFSVLHLIAILLTAVGIYVVTKEYERK